MSPSVSVIIRTYNRADYLGQAIESVLAQTFREFELIVVDDGSTDDTAALLARYSGRLTPIILNRTANPSAIFNAGIRAASGEFVAFLDDDDLWLPHKLEQQVKLLAENASFGFSYGNTRLLYPDGRLSAPTLQPDQIVSGSVLRTMVHNMCIHPSTTVVRHRWFDEVGLFDEGQLDCEDFFFFLRLARVTEAVCVSEPVSLIRRHDSQYSLARERSLFTYQAAVSALESLLQDGGDHPLPWRVRLEAHRSIARYLTHMARKHIEAGRVATGRRHVLRALRRYPFHTPAWRWTLRSFSAAL